MTGNPFADRLAWELERGWAVCARPNQLPPEGDWSIWLLLAGRGFGKTRVLSETANAWAITGQAKRIAIVAATAADARDVIVEGESGILATAPDWCRPEFQSGRRRLLWPNGAIGTLYSAEEPDRLRGPQHDAAICDELASWRDPSTWDMLQFGLRLGQHPRVVVATTPRPTKLVRQLLAREGNDVRVTLGSTYENRANLAPGFFNQIVSKYEGTRLGRQELLAEVLTDTPGALWVLDAIDQARRERAPDLQRVVVGLDPAVSSSEGSDETGIIVCGKDERGHGAPPNEILRPLNHSATSSGIAGRALPAVTASSRAISQRKTCVGTALTMNRVRGAHLAADFDRRFLERRAPAFTTKHWACSVTVCILTAQVTKRRYRVSARIAPV